MVLRRTGRAALVMLAALVCGCGKKGPPLPPLNLVPDRPANTAGRVAGDTVYLSITVPAKNANGRGALALDHLEIYAVTVDAGATVPPNRELLTKAHAIASIPIKPPADPDEAPDESAPPDTRPGGGDKIVFAEHLTDAQTTPEVMAKPSTTAATPAPQGSATTAAPGAAGMSTPAVPPLTSPESVPATGGGGGVVGVPSALPQTPATESATSGGEEPESSSSAAPGAPPQAASPVPAAPPTPAATVTRVYVIRGVTKKGHPGTPSARVVVPIVSPPPPPSNVSAEFGETSVTIKWSAPEAPAGQHAPFAYNVYAYSKSQPAETSPPLVSMPPPLNPQPIDTLALEHGGAEPGKEQCFVVRTVETIASTSIESEPSPPVCVTPVDRFAPEAPTGLAAVATTGAMNLIWDANHEPDVAGYLVLRAESPGDTLLPLTPEPIRETRFRDTTAQPGVRYAYVIVAVDRAGNRSAPSARVEETAR
ncbi:MAG TPA: hypothetical protein VL262_08020 [Vicinamibacterales bacterium]|nr:hypothetical protein [Vicinamibacterales bacterium]